MELLESSKRQTPKLWQLLMLTKFLKISVRKKQIKWKKIKELK
jgi:hypothetical protein